MKYKRILLKLSGEALLGDSHFGIEAKIINRYADIVKQINGSGVELGIVIGGGNIYRGIKSGETGIDKITGDKMGMLATVMNALAISDVLRSKHVSNRVLSAVSIGQFAEVYNSVNARKYLSSGEVCIFSGGTGNPLFTTDSAAALRAIEIKADVLIKATNVDGVYDSDPRNNPAAKLFDVITFDECIERNLKVMDQTAFVLCKENQLSLAVLNVNKDDSIIEFLRGGAVGTLVLHKK